MSTYLLDVHTQILSVACDKANSLILLSNLEYRILENLNISFEQINVFLKIFPFLFLSPFLDRTNFFLNIYAPLGIFYINLLIVNYRYIHLINHKTTCHCIALMSELYKSVETYTKVQ